MKSIHEQIANRCIHFTGIGNTFCRVGIKYHDVKMIDVKPFKFPCFKEGLLSGGHCTNVEFPSDEQIEKEVAELKKDVKKSMNAISAIKLHIDMTGEKFGTISCPSCGNKLRYSQADNGHIHAACKCGIGIME